MTVTGKPQLSSYRTRYLGRQGQTEATAHCGTGQVTLLGFLDPTRSQVVTFFLFGKMLQAEEVQTQVVSLGNKCL